MITIKVDADNVNKLIERVQGRLQQTLEQAIGEVMKNTADYIVLVAPENTGALKSSIKYELLESGTGTSVGRIYADMDIAPYALWVNYGTGLYAEGEGGSRAKRIPWFVHSSMADLSKYNYPTWTAPSGDMFYIVEGMHATHFFDDAPRQQAQQNIDIICERLKNMIEEASR